MFGSSQKNQAQSDLRMLAMVQVPPQRLHRESGGPRGGIVVRELLKMAAALITDRETRVWPGTPGQAASLASSYFVLREGRSGPTEAPQINWLHPVHRKLVGLARR